MTTIAEPGFFRKSPKDLLNSRMGQMTTWINGISPVSLLEHSIVELNGMVQDHFERYVKQDGLSIDFDPAVTRVMAQPLFESGVEKTSVWFSFPASGDPHVLEYVPARKPAALYGLLQVGDDEVWLVYTMERLDEASVKFYFREDVKKVIAAVEDLNKAIEEMNSSVEKEARDLINSRKERAEKNKQFAETLREGLWSHQALPTGDQRMQPKSDSDSNRLV